MAAQLHIFVNGKAFRVEDGVSDFMTGTEIAALVGVSPAKAVVRREGKINPKDLRIDTYRTSKSARHRDKSFAGVRIKHCPTELVVTSDGERSQIKNRAEAMRVLRQRLLERGYAKPRPVQLGERIEIESGDSFLVNSMSEPD